MRNISYQVIHNKRHTKLSSDTHYNYMYYAIAIISFKDPLNIFPP